MVGETTHTETPETAQENTKVGNRSAVSGRDYNYDYYSCDHCGSDVK